MILTYANPVWPGYMADPFVLKHGPDYFAYGTAPRDPGTGRHFRILKSRDLSHWEDLGCALLPLEGPQFTDYWAPEVAVRGGACYMYYSAGGHGGAGHKLRVALAERPEGPFEDTGRILLPDEPFSIDASPFRDPRDGQWYLFFARDYLEGDRPGTGTAVVPLADDMLSVTGAPRTVVRAGADWQIYERNRTWYGRDWAAWHTVEGPFVVYRGGRYYCMYSGGNWASEDYGVGYAVADHPLGPWTDAGLEGPNVLSGVSGRALGPGHNSVVTGPDGETDFIVYHAWDAARTARRMCIDPLAWTADGPRADGPSAGTRTVELGKEESGSYPTR